MSQELPVEPLIARAREAYARHQYVAALEDLEEAARRAPGFADVHNLIGLCLSLAGRPEDAVGAFERAIAVNPHYVEAHLNRAITLNDLGRLDEARVAFQNAAEADGERSSGPFSSAAAARLANKHAELGDLYAEAGGLAQAVAQYRAAAALRPQFLDIRNRLARTLVELGEPGAAAQELRAVLELRPAFVGARANLGLALFRLGDLDGAETEWRRCLEQQPANPQVSAYLGMVQRQRGATDG